MNTDEDFNNLHSLNKLYHDCMHMFDFATDCGKKLPDWVILSLKKISRYKMDTALEDEFLPAAEGESDGHNGSENEQSITKITADDLQELIKVYNTLTEIVAPATPLTIEYTIPTKKIFYIGGSLCMPFIRSMWVGCSIFLLGFIVSGFFTLANKNFIPLQLNLLFAAGLGSYFYALYAANKYAVDRTFDPKYVTFYFNRIILGIVAGLILTNIITDPKPIQSTQDAESITKTLTPALVAILGGFSSEAVMKILNRLVGMLVTLVQGEAKDIIETKEQEMKAKSTANIIKVKLNAARELYPFYNALKENISHNEFKKFENILDELVKTNGEVK